jgi:hypothetical protein
MTDSDTDDGQNELRQNRICMNKAVITRIKRNYYQKRIDEKIETLNEQRNDLYTDRVKYKFGITLLDELQIEDTHETKIYINRKVKFFNELLESIIKQLEIHRIKLCFLYELRSQINDSDDEEHDSDSDN